METRGLPSGKTTEFLHQYISGLIRGCYRKRTGVRRKGGDRDGEQQAETETWAKRCLAQQSLPETCKASKIEITVQHKLCPFWALTCVETRPADSEHQGPAVS